MKPIIRLGKPLCLIRNTGGTSAPFDYYYHSRQTILLDARRHTSSDDALLAEALKIFDYLSSAYRERKAE